MNRLACALLLALVFALAVPFPLASSAQSTPSIQVTSQYYLNRYGFATVNETVSFSNTGNASVTIPNVSLGFGNLSSRVISYNLTGTGFTPGVASGGNYTVLGGKSLAAGANSTFSLQALLGNVVETYANGTTYVQVVVRPYLNVSLSSLKEAVIMPEGTQFTASPTGTTVITSGNSTKYTSPALVVAQPEAMTQTLVIKNAAGQDFHPLVVYLAERTITVNSDYAPVVTDRLFLKNEGNTSLTWLYISPLVASDGTVTVIPPSTPHLLNAEPVVLSDDGIELATSSAIGSSVSPSANLTLTLQYPLAHKYYTSSNGVVTITLPDTAPIQAFIEKYVVNFSLPAGFKVVEAPPAASLNVAPIAWQSATLSMSYGLSTGWGVSYGVPGASVVFVILLIGLFVSRGATTREEESEEEESSAESASAMIKAFDDKTSLINSIWSEVASAEQKELNKAFFDEIRGRLDSFRSRALQRLNEVRRMSTSQRFFELLNQIHTTEREVDRAAKDKLNLYEQFYTKRMRKEVFDRLLPQYNKRLEKALNDLSDELHVVQREAKLL